MDSIVNDVHQEAQRGLLLQILVEWRLAWVPFHELRLHMMRRTGGPIPAEQVLYSLNYLTGNQYAEMKSLRPGRSEMELTVARATPKAVDLAEGRLSDEGIAL